MKRREELLETGLKEQIERVIGKEMKRVKRVEAVKAKLESVAGAGRGEKNARDFDDAVLCESLYAVVKGR